MNVTTPESIADLFNGSIMDARSWTPYYSSDADIIGVPLFNVWVTVAGVTTVMTGEQRFALVSSLYGPGNLACWLMLLLSVVIGWTLNPKSASKDTLTNDFIAAISMPVIASAHFFDQIHRQTGSRRGVSDLFSEPEWENVQMVAAIEASIAVCEDFLCWAAILHFLAGRKQQKMRMSVVIIVGWMCLSVELFLLNVRVPFEASLLIRPFIFHSVPILSILIVWFTFTALAYLIEVTYGAVLLYKHYSSQELESGNFYRRSMLWPGRVSSWMAACTGTVAGVFIFWIKYAWIYPIGRSKSVRFIPKSTVSISDLDQVVTLLAGLIALLFSMYDAVKERRKAHARKNEA